MPGYEEFSAVKDVHDERHALHLVRVAENRRHGVVGMALEVLLENHQAMHDWYREGYSKGENNANVRNLCRDGRAHHQEGHAKSHREVDLSCHSGVHCSQVSAKSGHNTPSRRRLKERHRCSQDTLHAICMQIPPSSGDKKPDEEHTDVGAQDVQQTQGSKDQYKFWFVPTTAVCPDCHPPVPHAKQREGGQERGDDKEQEGPAWRQQVRLQHLETHQPDGYSLGDGGQLSFGVYQGSSVLGTSSHERQNSSKFLLVCTTVILRLRRQKKRLHTCEHLCSLWRSLEVGEVGTHRDCPTLHDKDLVKVGQEMQLIQNYDGSRQILFNSVAAATTPQRPQQEPADGGIHCSHWVIQEQQRRLIVEGTS
mmetsp:Transcript_53788/g.96838  ORF Transcript_53788/g.96838 Transcript_53788/m.96838 type:complete len:366 (+) Transcript_53788:404-1501(+)